MKSFQQFNEEAKDELEKFMQKRVLGNPKIQELQKNLKSGKIDINQLKGIVNDKSVQEIPGQAKNMFGKMISNFGNSLQNK